MEVGWVGNQMQNRSVARTIVVTVAATKHECASKSGMYQSLDAAVSDRCGRSDIHLDRRNIRMVHQPSDESQL